MDIRVTHNPSDTVTIANHATDTEVWPTCPACESESPAHSFLGQLGRLLWFRCRFCGIEFNKIATEDNEF